MEPVVLTTIRIYAIIGTDVWYKKGAINGTLS
jgi:hypothetical protein